jgi:RES domain-containing protein
MQLWRVTRAARREHAFAGKYAARFGARWNPPGAPAVYLAGSLALAVLESLVHVQSPYAPPDLLAIPVDVPDDVTVQEVTAAGLPAKWQDDESAFCKTLGSTWHRTRKHALLQVPSAVLPLERNYVANPLHPDFQRLDVSHHGYPLRFDSRLIGFMDAQATQE